MRFSKGVVPTLHNEKLQELYRQMHPGLPVPDDIAVHPTPLYDIILAMTFFAIIWRLRHRQFPAGTLFGMYFIAAGVERFITEFWRTTPKLAFGWMTMAQMISIAMIITGILIIRARRQASQSAAAKPQKVKQAL
jgi:phosphatidylglycerol:prolipoprotein diacylglycerol transferase